MEAVAYCRLFQYNACLLYTSGGKKTPAVTVTDAEGKVLTKGTDYTVTYENNINVGTASAIITGKGCLLYTSANTNHTLFGNVAIAGYSSSEGYYAAADLRRGGESKALSE